MAGNDCGALLDEELSSFFLNYLADTQVRLAGEAGPGPEVLSCGGCCLSRGGREAAVGALGVSEAPGCRVPLPCALRCAPSRRQGAIGPPRACRNVGDASAAGEGLGLVSWSPPPRRRSWGVCIALPWGGGAAPSCEGTLRLALGAGGAPSDSRHLLPYFHVDLGPRHRRLPPTPESPSAPVSGTPRAASGPLRLITGARRAEFPASCLLWMDIGVCGARGRAGGDNTFLESPPGGEGGQDDGGRTVWGPLGPPAARGPGARSAMLGEGKARRRPGLWLLPGSPSGDPRVTGVGALLWWSGEREKTGDAETGTRGTAGAGSRRKCLR